jgi:putative nucleotidyltransferase with HDIG domain
MSTSDRTSQPEGAAVKDKSAPVSRLPRIASDYSADAHEQRQLRHAMALVTQQCRSLEDQLHEAQDRNQDLLTRIARYAGGETDDKLREQNLSLCDQHQRDLELIEKLQQELRQTVREKARLHADVANAANALDQLADASTAEAGLPDDWQALPLAERIGRLQDKLAHVDKARDAAVRKLREVELQAEGLSGPTQRPPRTRAQIETVKVLARQLEQMRSQLDTSLARNRELTGQLEARSAPTDAPDAAIVFLPEVASAQTPAPLSEEARRLVTRIRHQVRRLDELGREPAWDSEEAIPERFRNVAGLVETALRSVHTMRSDPADQAIQCQSLSCLIDMVDAEIQHLEATLVRERQNLQFVRRLDDLFSAVRRGQHPGFSKVEQLASEITADVADYPLSALVQPYTSASMGYVISHSINVARLASYLAQQSSKWRSRAKLAASAALVHDIGMGQVPPEAYDHPHELSERNRELVREHAAVGAWVSETITGLPAEIPSAVAQHHERLDGSGYPEGLSDEEIDDLARLVAVVDTYESMTAPRPHRLAKLPREAMGELLEEAEAGRLDRKWVERFLCLSFYPVGSYVELSSGETARVVAAGGVPADPRFASRPVVQLVTDRLGRKMWTPEFVNLANCPDRHITRALPGASLSIQG